MKIEKISETQIRCTLNKNDFADRHLRISELAYGSEKAKALFHDMIQQASTEFGFDTDNFPVMIEAIPVSPDCLILVITKVEDPDELDTRFSNFTLDEEDEDEEAADDELSPEERATADQILQCFEQINELLMRKATADGSLKLPDFSKKKKGSSAETGEDDEKDGRSARKLIYSFRFASLAEVTALAGVIAPFYHGENSLYKSSLDSSYHLVLHMSEHRPADFNKVCNITCEYGTQERFGEATASYFDEHMECIIRDKAVQMLKQLN